MRHVQGLTFWSFVRHTTSYKEIFATHFGLKVIRVPGPSIGSCFLGHREGAWVRGNPQAFLVEAVSKWHLQRRHVGPGLALYLEGQTITSKSTLEGTNQSSHHYNQMSGSMDLGEEKILVAHAVRVFSLWSLAPCTWIKRRSSGSVWWGRFCFVLFSQMLVSSTYKKWEKLETEADPETLVSSTKQEATRI